jgi:hypothetical protein
MIDDELNWLILYSNTGQSSLLHYRSLSNTKVYDGKVNSSNSTVDGQSSIIYHHDHQITHQATPNAPKTLESSQRAVIYR